MTRPTSATRVVTKAPTVTPTPASDESDAETSDVQGKTQSALNQIIRPRTTLNSSSTLGQTRPDTKYLDRVHLYVVRHTHNKLHSANATKVAWPMPISRQRPLQRRRLSKCASAPFILWYLSYTTRVDTFLTTNSTPTSRPCSRTIQPHEQTHLHV